MIRKSLLFFLFFNGIVLIGIGQEKTKKSSCGCRFQSVNQIGLIDGSTDTEFHLQTINGLRFGNWFTGIGVGIDYYYVRSVPLFVDIRNYWFKKKNSPFVYGDIGINFPWPKDLGNDFSFQDINYNEGLYYDLGLGYKLGLRNTHALSLSAGFNFKRLTGVRQYKICTFMPCVGTTEEFDYKLNRISMKFGWEF